MHVIDSHTGGEPTRVILDGGPDLGSGPLAERAKKLASEHWDFCTSVMLEPRGQVAMVGALLVPPTDPECVTGVIYFDAGAVLGMCGHGTIGLGVTLGYLGRIGAGTYKIETPAGMVEISLTDANTVTVRNIESRRIQKGISVDIEGLGTVRGDVAYGGNWFFIADESPEVVLPSNIDGLTRASISIREALRKTEAGAKVDHIILRGAPSEPGISSRNFVLCPDNAYDRSPCGTGSSGWLSCLAADNIVAPGQEIVIESIVGSKYTVSYVPGDNGGIIPSITGQAYVMAESKLVFDPNDPFVNGIKVLQPAL